MSTKNNEFYIYMHKTYTKLYKRKQTWNSSSEHGIQLILRLEGQKLVCPRMSTAGRQTAAQ
jgi:hypothetical protein